jgi:hypothetical protein
MGDPKDYDRTPAAIRDAAHGREAELQRAGAVMGIAGPPVQVRNPEGSGTTTAQGPFMSSPLPIAGFAVIDAASLDEAVKIVSGCPCAVAHGVIEVWPLET